MIPEFRSTPTSLFLEKSEVGFTLIEALIYIGLFVLVIGGLLAVVFGIIENSNKIQARTAVQEEANFLLKKIGWALSGATSIALPASGSSGPGVTLNKLNFASNPISFCLSGGKVKMQTAAACSPSSPDLNSDNTTASALQFTHAAASGNLPESLTAGFTLTGKTSQGALQSFNFSSTKYLRN